MDNKNIFSSNSSSFPEQISFDKNKRQFFSSEPSSQQNAGNLGSAESNNNQGNQSSNSGGLFGNNNGGGLLGNTNLSSILPLLGGMLPKNTASNPLFSSLLSGKQLSPTDMISSMLSQTNLPKKEVVQATPLLNQKLNLDNIKKVDDYYKEGF